MTIKEFNTFLGVELHRRGLAALTPLMAKAEGKCLFCGELAAPRTHTEAGIREYSISLTCEECFDQMFEEENDSTDERDQT